MPNPKAYLLMQQLKRKVLVIFVDTFINSQGLRQCEQREMGVVDALTTHASYVQEKVVQLG